MSKKNFRIVAIVCTSVIIIFAILLLLPSSQNITPEQQDVSSPAPVPNPVVTAPAAPPAQPGQNTGLLSANFQFPYPVSWVEGGIQFDLTGVSLGKRAYPASNLLNMDSSASGQNFYPPGWVGNLLIFSVKVSNKTQAGNSCAPLTMRRVVNEEGDMAPPNIAKFNFPSGGCGIDANTTYTGQEIPFVVPETENEFTLTTGGSSNIFFSVSAASGTIRVENISEQKQG